MICYKKQGMPWAHLSHISYFVGKLVLINVSSLVLQVRENNGQLYNCILSTNICEDKGKRKQFGWFLMQR